MNKDVVAAETGMLIRRPVADVFEALIKPEVTTRFWFTRSSGWLEAGKRVQWTWEMYGQSGDVDVDVVEENKRIVLRWPAYDGKGQTTVASTRQHHVRQRHQYRLHWRSGRNRKTGDRSNRRLHACACRHEGAARAWHRTEPHSRSLPERRRALTTDERS